ncbi:MAG TPA: hypothetical protein VMV92_35595 [Streptosporangiaceae bacterium]|nr:hypothetical protein [Streptosporangiaceae bacterium]
MISAQRRQHRAAPRSPETARAASRAGAHQLIPRCRRQQPVRGADHAGRTVTAQAPAGGGNIKAVLAAAEEMRYARKL